MGYWLPITRLRADMGTKPLSEWAVLVLGAFGRGLVLVFTGGWHVGTYKTLLSMQKI